VASNDDAKRLLKEAVVMPIKYPMLFQGLLSPWYVCVCVCVCVYIYVVNMYI
jgi:hypothetical protein